ncbi:MAG: hypothetical protein L6Q71_01270 [Planctomycetes bacterium]|nr:hypothetical protein [Planctomycetota bacterium]NUQ34186.1 hypothetical protein [Planctomycetaceae bacterium]
MASHRSLKRDFPSALAACALLALLFHVSSYASLAQDAQPTEPNKEEETKAAAAIEVARDIEPDASIGGEDTSLQYRFARVEQSLNLAYQCLRRDQPQQANQYFDAAYSMLLGIRKENLSLTAPEMIVRDRNLARGKFIESPSGDLWRPLSEHLNVWLAQLPRNYHDDFDQRFGTEARDMLKTAHDRHSMMAIRDVSFFYFYTEAGETAAAELIAHAFEQGDMLDVVAQTMRLKEMRPYLYRDVPLWHAQLLVALEMLGDFELLALERDFAKSVFARAQVRIGDERKDFNSAVETLRTTFGLGTGAGPRQSFKLASLEEPRVHPLASSIELTSSGPSGKAPPSTLPELTVHNGGLLVPRADDALLWLPNIESDETRILTLSAADRNVRVSNTKRPSNRFSYRQYGDTGPNARLRGAMVIPRLLSAYDGADLRHARTGHWLAATLGTGTSATGELTGNNIQIFDLDAEGTIIATLPRRDEENAADLGRTHFGGVPAVSGDTLLIMGSISVSPSTELYLHCFDVSPQSERFGRLLWRKKVAGAKDPAGYSMWGDRWTSPIIETATVTVRGRQAFVSANCGVAACYDVRDGKPVWFVEYRKRKTASFSGWGGWNPYQFVQSLNIFPASMTLSGSVAIAAPSDAVHALALNAYDGSILKPLLRDLERSYDTAKFFVGVHEGYAIFQTTDVLEAEPLTYAGVVRAKDGSIGYGKPLRAEGIPAGQREQIDGSARALVVGDVILVPGHDGVVQFDAYTLAYTGFMPWPDMKPEPAAPAKDEKAALDTKTAPVRVPGLVSIHWLERGPGGKPALARLDAKELKIYPVTFAREE